MAQTFTEGFGAGWVLMEILQGIHWVFVIFLYPPKK